MNALNALESGRLALREGGLVTFTCLGAPHAFGTRWAREPSGPLPLLPLDQAPCGLQPREAIEKGRELAREYGW